MKVVLRVLYPTSCISWPLLFRRDFLYFKLKFVIKAMHAQNIYKKSIPFAENGSLISTLAQKYCCERKSAPNRSAINNA